MGKHMFENKRLMSVAAALLVSVSSAAFAAEVPASFDAKSCKADYPKASLMNEEQGTVSMSFLVNADGSVADSKVDKSSGFKNLDQGRLRLEAGLIHLAPGAGLPAWPTPLRAAPARVPPVLLCAPANGAVAADSVTLE